VILVDTNIPLYAEDSLSEHHEQARKWWDEQLSGSEPVALSWPSLTAFIRFGTNARLHKRPLTLKEAVERVQSWLNQPCVYILSPAEQHWAIFPEDAARRKCDRNLASDAHLAALAVENNCTLVSSDTEFARFRGLKWRNPIAPK